MTISGLRPRSRASKTRAQTPALLKGLLFAPNGHAMSPTHTRRNGRLYRYYVTQTVLKLGPETCPRRRTRTTPAPSSRPTLIRPW